MVVIASKPLKAGDIVFKWEPLVHAIDNDYKSRLCNTCLKRSDQLNRCSKCLQMYYCDKECQQKDWKYHKSECKVMLHINFDADVFTANVLLLLRLYGRIKCNKSFATKTYQMFDGSKVCLENIEVNKKSIGNSMFRTICQLFKSCDFGFNAQELHHWCGFIDQNHYRLPFYGDNCHQLGAMIGSAATAEVSVISHSCLPNTAFVPKGLTIEIRAIKSIDIGEEITYSTISLEMPREDRWMALYDINRGHSCQCGKCQLLLDIGINYKEFQRLMAAHKKQWMRSMIDGFSNANEWYEMDTKFVNYLYAIYGEYHPIITCNLLMAFICFTNGSRRATQPLVSHWFKRIERHILVTHGSDNPWYTLLCKCYSNYK